MPGSSPSFKPQAANPDSDRRANNATHEHGEQERAPVSSIAPTSMAATFGGAARFALSYQVNSRSHSIASKSGLAAAASRVRTPAVLG